MPQQTAPVAATPSPASPAQATGLPALQQRRELLADQYETAMHSRGQIGQERLNAQARGDASMVREYDGAIERLGARLQDLERSIAATDQQIDQALKSTGDLGALPALAPIAIPGQPSVQELLAENAVQYHRLAFQYKSMMVGEGVVFAILVAFAWRFGFARGRRHAPRVEAPRDDSKLQQSIDAIAIEVERLSEGQRFVNNVMSARRPEREALPAQPPLAAPGESTWITPH